MLGIGKDPGTTYHKSTSRVRRSEQSPNAGLKPARRSACLIEIKDSVFDQLCFGALRQATWSARY